MAIPSRQIGWSTTDNLLWQISKQVESLGCVVACGTSGGAGSSGTSGISGLSGTSGTSGVVGTSGTAGVSGTAGISGTAGTSGTSPSFPYPLVYGLFAQTSNSSTVTNTTTETSIVGSGVGTLSVPAGAFSVGDSFSGRMVGHISSKNNDTIRIKVKSGSVILGDSGLITMPQTTSKIGRAHV